MTPVPPLTPYLTVSDAAAAIAFYKQGFGAVQEGEAHYAPGSQKIMHARLLINGSLIMLADDFAEMKGEAPMTPLALGGSPVTLALQLEDAQPFWDRAVEAGAKVTMPLADQFWGARYGQLVDPFGHKWSLSQTLRVLSEEQIQEAAKEAFPAPQAN
jgi:PhnB protein